MENIARRWIILPVALVGLLWSGPITETAWASPGSVVFDQDVDLGGQGTFRHEPSIAFNPANPSNTREG